MEENISTKTHEQFKEVEEVNSLIDQTLIRSNDEILMEVDYERLTVILDEYQEQPHLLDPYIGHFITKLIAIIRLKDTKKSAFHQSFKFLYLFTKVRGYKQTLRSFSHDVVDLQFVLNLLKEQSLSDHQTWEARYVLLLWLSIICIIPFDLAKLDGSTHISDKKSVVNGILDTTLPYLDVSDKSRDAAAYLLARFITRPDVNTMKMEEFFKWSADNITTNKTVLITGMNKCSGILSTLALIFKHGRRKDLLPHATYILDLVISLNILMVENTLIRKLSVKLVQRIGLVFLAPRIAAWRYKRGKRSLAQNLTNSQEENYKTCHEYDRTIDEEEEFDIPEEVELILEFLISGLKDKDTIVRWSAAKGVGRLTGRLPEELADEVLGSLLEVFIFSEMDGAWHGGCLALAELGRRGLLLPSRLPEVVQIILKALNYDERRGSYSVGSHVRDAACYVCWSFARAYGAEEIKPFVLDIARGLLIVTVFDREVNCRRAASAAFQENVGRQGSFPHGIDILTAADYLAVGNRAYCYKELSVYIAGFTEYNQPLIDHVVHVKISHWNSDLRELASKTLHLLTKTAPKYMRETVLPILVAKTSSIDLCTKHGSILAVGEVIHALFCDTRNRDAELYSIDPKLIDEIKQLVRKLRKTNEFKGFGGELMRKAVCKLIENLSLSEIPINELSVLEDWLYIIQDTIPHTETHVQDAAISTLPYFCNQYVKNSTYFKPESIVTRHCDKLQVTLKFDRMGFACSLGSLPSFMLQNHVKLVIGSLIKCVVVDENKVEAGLYAEARRNAVNAILSIVETVGIGNITLGSMIQNIYSSLFTGMNDYTTDSRGDVGAWVREASMYGLVNLTKYLNQNDPMLITEQICNDIMCCLVQQASEKIDRTRACGGNLLVQFIHLQPELQRIPHRKELTILLPSSMINKFNWASANDGFKAITKLLQYKIYQYPILLGLTTSVGGLTESLVRDSSDFFLGYLTRIQGSKTEMDCISENILKVLENYHKDNRVIIPMFKMLDLILSSGCLDIYNNAKNSSEFPMRLFLLLKDEIKGCSDAKKLLASVNIFCGLVQFNGEVQHRTLQQLMVFLCHRYPRIRRGTAEQLYTTFLMYDDILAGEHSNDVMTNLTEVSWDGSVESLRPIRDQLCNWLNVKPPKLKEKTNVQVVTKNKQQVDELASYQDLVSRHGGF